MKCVRKVNLLLCVTLLFLSTSCVAREINPVHASPGIEMTTVPTPIPTSSLIPTPSPAPQPSFAFDPDKPFAALRAYMDAEIAAAPDLGAAPFEEDMLNAIAHNLWYYGKFSEYASIERRKVDYVVYAMPFSEEVDKVAIIAEDEDFGLVVQVTPEGHYVTGVHLGGYYRPDNEQSIVYLQEETADRQLVYKNTVTIPEAARGQEKALARPEMRDSIMDAALAYVIAGYGVEKGWYSVVVGDYGDEISTRLGAEGCLEARFILYICGEAKDYHDSITFVQEKPGDSLKGVFSTKSVDPNYTSVKDAFPRLTPPGTDEEWAWQEEEVDRRLKEYHDYQWQRLLDQGVYAKEITVE